MPLHWCGYAFCLFQEILGQEQYYPTGAEPSSKFRLFGQFHALQTQELKDKFLDQSTSAKSSTVRVMFATVAMGLGVNIQNIREVIHITPHELWRLITNKWVMLEEMVYRPQQPCIITTRILHPT